MSRLVDVLSAARRPESIRTWMRSAKVQALLTDVASGAVPLSHDGLDAYASGTHVEHLRALLEHHQILPAREHFLALFEQWLERKLASLRREIAQPVEQFARWHHLHRIRAIDPGDRTLRGPVHHAKQEITETIKFLTWLDVMHGRTAATCLQSDVDAYLHGGPTTRYFIRTFFVFANARRINPAVTVPHRMARSRPSMTQDQRMAWIRELLTGESESLPFRTAGMLLLLLAQPLVKISALRVDAVHDSPGGMSLALGKHPTPLPEPFAALLRAHVHARPNLNTASHASDWLFPSPRAGRHLHPNTVMDRLRRLGVELRGARNRALDDLVNEIPPPVVADALGYSHATAFSHQQADAGNWARYVAAHRPQPHS
ncbi:recombinase XerD [Cellulomonas xiejunii]|uniref:Recombinase XerD n=1 Tax=Cellulomonas xiejunii TaxID=2968083 RepID=A0ABY5KT72_9CELL|nr:recombinase XerD [Cellulomonas xiejunii]MCC2323152.1 recombinase XerD [Cellulomonas xiejunii]UUI73639.1 recombinase XerD [Cellulomonas xiejunii]